MGRRVFGVRRVVHIDDVCSVDGGAAVSPGRVAREMRCICFLSEEENVLKTIKSNRVFTKTSSLCRRPKEGERERESDNVAHKSDRRLSDGENHHGGREDFPHAETRRRRDVDHFHVFPRLVDGSVESGREVSIQ